MTAEDHLRMNVGQLIFQISDLQAQVAGLQADLAKLKPKEASCPADEKPQLKKV